MTGRMRGRSEHRPPIRVVVLGASNVTTGIATVVETARRIFGRPLDVLAAAGLGRAYGVPSQVLLRTLPSILSCGLWNALETRPPAQTFALVTDIGNDVIYGASPAHAANSVDACLARLATCANRIVVTRLPLEGIGRLSRWRFRLFRTLFFPGSRLDWKVAAGSAKELDGHVTALAEKYGARLVEPDARWFGLDPIHIRRRCWPEAWMRILGPWASDASIPPVNASRRMSFLLRTRRPQQQGLAGFELRTRQPAARLSDGTTVSFY